MSLAPPPLLRLRWFTTALVGYTGAALVWLTFGDALPGGRWFAVHLFTLGILTNAVVALSEHFTRALLPTTGPDHRTQRFALLNTGALLVLGFPPTLRYPIAVGATLLAATVAWLAVDLRRIGKGAQRQRFAFVARGYQLACGAFFVGAVLGGLLGTVTLRGAWYGAGRLAHLHVNILGWGGLTLLTTLVFFGPTLLRAQMVENAEYTASRAVPLAAGGLLLATIGLIVTGSGAPGLARGVAAAGLALYAVAASAVCGTVFAAGRHAQRSVNGAMIQATCVWLVITVWADVVIVALGRPRLLDALGAILIVAVLGQAIIATVNYLTPEIWVHGQAARTSARERLESFAMGRVALLNAGAVLVGGSALAGPGAGTAGAMAARGGWVLVTAALFVQGVLFLRTLLSARPAEPA